MHQYDLTQKFEKKEYARHDFPTDAMPLCTYSGPHRFSGWTDGTFEMFGVDLHVCQEVVMAAVKEMAVQNTAI